MGAFDNLGRLCESQAVAATNTWSTNFIDLVDTVSQVGVGTPVWLNIRVAVAPTDAGDTCAIQAQMSATNDGTNLSGTIKNLFTLCDDALAELAVTDARLTPAGAWTLRMPLPMEATLRYLQLKFIQGTSNGTQTYDAWLSATPPDSDRGVEILVSPVGQP